jgi:hypothetical protein
VPDTPDPLHLAALAARSRAEAAALADMLRERCWPGGEDRTVPAARDWVRRWGPRGLAPALDA